MHLLERSNAETDPLREPDKLHKSSSLFLSVFLAFVFASSIVCVSQTGKIEPIGPLVDTSVSEQVRQSMEDHGYRLTLDSSKPECEIWFRKNLPLTTATESEGVAYPGIAESTLLGVIKFLDAASDFRGHKVPPGFYTLRYELMPEDGNHLGAAPNRDFALLVPSESDSDPSASYKAKELIAMSAKVAGTRHPAPLSLAPADKVGTANLAKDDQDHWIFSVGLKAAGGKDFPFAMIVKGTAQQ